MLNNCPVCHMDTPSDQPNLVYRNKRFAFCSEACRESFGVNPHLYTKVDGRDSCNQHSVRALNFHCVLLESPISTEQAQILSEAIGIIVGVKLVVFEGREVQILFDQLEVMEEQMEQAVVETGIRLDENWKAVQRALRHYTKECEEANIEIFDNVYTHYHS